jgi:tetratricopeptide (TPR) repeat protein
VIGPGRSRPTMTIDDLDAVEMRRLKQWSTLTDEDAADVAPGTVRMVEGDGPAGRFLLIHGRSAAEAGESASAYDTLLDRKVLLRFVEPEPGPPGTLAAILGGATAMARLSHPNVVKVHDVGMLDGRPFIATELVEGATLEEWGRQRRSAREIAAVVSAAARGVAAAHAQGIVHGDLTSERILLAGDRVLVAGPGRQAAQDPGADLRALGGVLYGLVHGRPLGSDPAPPPRERDRARLHRLALAALAGGLGAQELADAVAVDPGRHRRRIIVTVAALAATSLAFVAGIYVRQTPERRCRAGGAAIAGVWNEGRRAELGRRYAAVREARPSWPALVRQLDEYVARWREAHDQVCRAAYGWRGISDQIQDQRMRCLTVGRVSLETFLASLDQAPAGQLTAAAKPTLPDLAHCTTIDRAERKPPPSDPASRAALESAERLVAQALHQQNLGAYLEAAATAGRAVEVARKLGHDPTLAVALIQQASCLSDAAGNGAAADGPLGSEHAKRLLEEAYAAADRGEDDHDRLTAASYLVLLHARGQTYAEGERWAQLAEALAQREETPPDQVSSVEGNIGFLEKFRNHRARAAAAFRKAVEYAEKVVPQEPRRIAVAQVSMCEVLDEGPPQIACARRAVEMGRAAFGPDNPESGLYEAILAEALSRVPSTHAEACRTFRQARATLGQSVEASNANAIAILSELGECLAYEGEIAEARQLLEEVIARRPGPIDLAYAQGVHAYLEARYRSLAAAVPELRASLAGYRKGLEPCDDRVLLAEDELATTLGRHGEVAEAQRVLREGLAACEKAGEDSSGMVDLRDRQGRLLLDEGRLEPALRTFEDALRRHERLGSKKPQLAFSLHGLGAAQLGLGHTEAALASLERAYRARPAANEPLPELRADISLALARALRARSRDRERACALGREAAAGYRRLTTFGRELHDAERWLIRQGCTPSS